MAARTRTTFVAGQILTAAQANALGAGWLGYVLGTSDLGSVTTSESTIPELQETVTYSANRVIHVSANISVKSTVADDVVRVRLYRGSDVMVARDFVLRVANQIEGLSLNRVWASSSSASELFKVTVVRQAGSGTLTVEQSSSAPGVLLVEDLGAV